MLNFEPLNRQIFFYLINGLRVTLPLARSTKKSTLLSLHLTQNVWYIIVDKGFKTRMLPFE